MYVIKKDGTKSPFNFGKIVDMVEGATSNLEDSVETTENILDSFQLLVRNNIPTTEIQDQLLNTVKNKIDIEHSDMSIVAGKLLMSTIISDAEKTRGFEFGELRRLYDYNLESGLYEPNIDLTTYYEILKYLEDHIDRADNYEYNYTSAASWKLRYLHKAETPVEVFALIAARLALHTDVKLKQQKDIAKKYLKVLSKQQISLATPFLLNLRIKNGNLSSCFINTVPDDLLKQYDVLKDMALISKNGGGIGAYFGTIRAKGSRIRTVEGIADSVIPYSTLVNQTMTYVNQQGKRKGASTVALPIWHADILEFLELVTESGDARRKAMDLFLQVVVEETFMVALRDDLDYAIVCPLEVKEKLGLDLNNDMTLYKKNYDKIIEGLTTKKLKVGKVIRAREIFKSIMGATLIKGNPYWFYSDNANSVNPMKDVGSIKCGNLCNESYSVTTEKYTHTCNLVSLVLPNINLKDELEDVSKIAVDMLDTIVDVSTPPTAKAKKHNDDFRVLGIGAMGLADTLAINKKTYDKDLDFIEDIFERISLYTLEQSVWRAKEYGKFPMYDKSEWAKGKIYSRDIEWYKNNSKYYEEWKTLKDLISKYGVRNLQLQAVAPNTSSSVLQGVTASIFPTFSKFHMDSSSLGALPVMPKYIKDSFWYYKEYKHYGIKDMNTFVSKVQKWVDSGISYEWVIDLDTVTINDIADYYVDAWAKGVKGIYYIRWLRSDGSVDDKEECSSCAG